MRPVSQARIAEYRQEKRKVSASSCISVDNQLYRIPGDLGNSTVDVLIGKEKLIVFHEGKTVTTLNLNFSQTPILPRSVAPSIMGGAEQRLNLLKI